MEYVRSEAAAPLPPPPQCWHKCAAVELLGAFNVRWHLVPWWVSRLSWSERRKKEQQRRNKFSLTIKFAKTKKIRKIVLLNFIEKSSEKKQRDFGSIWFRTQKPFEVSSFTHMCVCVLCMSFHCKCMRFIVRVCISLSCSFRHIHTHTHSATVSPLVRVQSYWRGDEAVLDCEIDLRAFITRFNRIEWKRKSGEGWNGGRAERCGAQSV